MNYLFALLNNIDKKLMVRTLILNSSFIRINLSGEKPPMEEAYRFIINEIIQGRIKSREDLEKAKHRACLDYNLPGLFHLL